MFCECFIPSQKMKCLILNNLFVRRDNKIISRKKTRKNNKKFCLFTRKQFYFRDDFSFCCYLLSPFLLIFFFHFHLFEKPFSLFYHFWLWFCTFQNWKDTKDEDEKKNQFWVVTVLGVQFMWPLFIVNSLRLVFLFISFGFKKRYHINLMLLPRYFLLSLSLSLLQPHYNRQTKHPENTSTLELIQLKWKLQ